MTAASVPFAARVGWLMEWLDEHLPHRWLRQSRRGLAKQWGWGEETQRHAILHVLDPAARFDAKFEAKLRRFYEARP